MSVVYILRMEMSGDETPIVLELKLPRLGALVFCHQATLCVRLSTLISAQHFDRASQAVVNAAATNHWIWSHAARQTQPARTRAHAERSEFGAHLLGLEVA